MSFNVEVICSFNSYTEFEFFDIKYANRKEILIPFTITGPTEDTHRERWPSGPTFGLVHVLDGAGWVAHKCFIGPQNCYGACAGSKHGLSYQDSETILSVLSLS